MRIKYLLGLLFCFAWTMPLFSQTISGTVNTYAGVNAIAGNAFTVTSSAGFAVGDLVLVIQMKGASITQTNSPAYGDITGYGNAGNYEFNTVGSIAGNVITLACNLTNAYDIPGRVQLVRVPQYTNVTVTGTLTAQDWNGTTGGVLAIDVSNTLTLNANIDVSNRGFRGGTVGAGGFNCAHSTYFSPTNQGGTKGEAIANAIAGQETARGKLANGGGGSNAGNCGAGGGSNFGTGGLGGTIYSGCGASTIQGVGGTALTLVNGRVFMGGGGGGGFRDNGQTCAPGGDGGGIVIIMAGTISGNGNSILARGENVVITTNDEGAGAGGGGGTVYLDCNNFPTALTVNTSGGSGGNVLNGIFTSQCHGPGGGGGGGLLWVAPAALPGNITHTSTGGAAGIVQTVNAPCFNTTYQGTAGNAGGTNLNLTIPISTGGTTVNLGPDTTLCAGDTLLLDATTAGATYDWQDGSTNSTFEVTASGQYHVTVTGGCSSGADTINVTFVPNPVVNIGADQTICDGVSAVFDAGPGMTSYLWQNGSTAQTFTGTLSGQVDVTVTDANGCTSADTAQLTVNPLPPVNLGPDVAICQGGSQIFDAGAPAGVSSYLWQNNATTQTITATTTGQYSVTLTDVNGCQNADTVQLTVNALPTPNLGNDLNLCNGSTVVLNPGAGYTSYAWNTGAITPFLLVFQSGTYSVTVTDANGCQGSDQVKVTVHPNPVVDLGGDEIICVGEVLNLTPGSGFSSYNWSTGATSPSINVSTAGTYWVSVIDGNNCVGRDTAVVTVQVVSVNLGPDIDLCEGDGVILSAGNGFNSYLWEDGSNTQNHYVNQVGTYSVTATTTEGCSATDQMQVLSIIPVPKVNLGGPYDICEGQQVILNPGSGPWSFLWNDGSTTQKITVTDQGVYTVTATNSCGSVSQSVRVNNLGGPPVFSLGPDLVFCRDTVSITANATGNYLWSNGYTGQTLQIAHDQGGQYSVVVTNACGTGEDEINLTEDCPPQVWVPTGFTPNGDGLNDVFKPVALDIGDYTLQIYDRWGKLIFQSMNIEQGWDGTFAGKGLPEGVYVYRIDYLPLTSVITETQQLRGSVTLVR